MCGEALCVSHSLMHQTFPFPFIPASLGVPGSEREPGLMYCSSPQHAGIHLYLLAQRYTVCAHKPSLHGSSSPPSISLPSAFHFKPLSFVCFLIYLALAFGKVLHLSHSERQSLTSVKYLAIRPSLTFP